MFRPTPALTSLALAGALAMTGTSSAFASESDTPNRTAEPTYETVPASEVEWEPLNPARGASGPQAATLWGDRNGSVATGFLVKFVDGFASPPHIHNVSYRGMVISGLVHNDDPDAAEMWMPAGSFWTQPKGEVHITAAKGTTNVGYIEIEAGPYLVLPTEEEFDSGERPVNVDASNIVWLDASQTTWVDPAGAPASATSAHGPEIAFLWGNAPGAQSDRPDHSAAGTQGDRQGDREDGQLNGTLVRLPAGYAGEIHAHGSTFRAVVIQGRPQYQLPGGNDLETLEPGSYFGSEGASVHQVSGGAEGPSIIYVRTDGRYDVTPEGAGK